ncbi:type II toxin-antitoxin system VapC family toxin [Moraxella nasovis]|uniref:type II toxin-antitoxin system VapC family toxin n=1 Tax=Moraxella nasovis TaxID=2904121 RepID=UPI001F611703|nr:type II toxin-antitoxin system VapC family toxin [Moraxella nasovis]UNU73366.1 type II toxin-antitoxin system VapC family toxin [Moraxella nasovis]
MKYLLDTNIIIALQKQNPVLIARLKQRKVSDFALSDIVLFELYYGAYHSQKQRENLAKIDKLPFVRLPFDDKDALCAGKVRADLQRQGQVIGAYDMLIAGQALSKNLTLITHNVKEFSRVDGLKWQNWLE